MKIKQTKGDRVFMTFVSIGLTLFFILTLYPLIYVLSASISDPTAVSTGEMWLFPVGLSLQGYDYLFNYQTLWTSYANTILYTVANNLFALFLTIPCAYALSRRDMKGRSAVMAYFMVTMYIGGGLIPAYLNIVNLGLLNTRTLMIVLGGFSVYNMIVARTFFSGLSWEMHEAARIDGANDLQIFLRIVMPLSKPILVVLMLYYGVGKWNTYFDALIYLKDCELFPLQIVLREVLFSSGMTGANMEGMSTEALNELFKQEKTANMLRYGTIVVSTLPMLMIYPWLQKFFAKGVMIGSVKG